MTRAVNLRAESYDVYIGRGSVWGNPYRIGKDGDRKTVVEKYLKYLISCPELLRQVITLRGKRLGCFCKPALCHGDLLARLADYIHHYRGEQMAYGNRFKGKGKGKGKGVRLTGLFKTKKKGCYVGKMRAEEIKPLRVLLKNAIEQEKDVAVFMYRNEEGDGPLFSLKADISEDFRKGGFKKKSRPVEDEDDAGDGDEGDELSDGDGAEDAGGDDEGEEVDV